VSDTNQEGVPVQSGRPADDAATPATDATPVEPTFLEPTGADEPVIEPEYARPDDAAEPSATEPPALVEPPVEPATESPVEPAAQPVAVPVASTAAPAAAADTVVLEPAHASPTEPVVATSNPAVVQTETGLPPVAPDNRVVYVEPIEPPQKRGNRGFGFLFVIIATIVFAALYALAGAIIIGLSRPEDIFGGTFTGFLKSTAFWVPPLFFFVIYLLLALIVNRAGWWAYIIGSVIVGLVVYFGSIGVFVLQEHITGLTPAKAGVLFEKTATQPFVILGGLLARETALWFGAAIAARGRRVKARNVEAREQFERDEITRKEERDAQYAPQS
jgi:hypothetical protein